MSVEQTNVVDFVALGKEEDAPALLIVADHLPWDGDHVLLLQEKLNTYLAFVESGQLVEQFPRAANRRVHIDVACKYPPDDFAEHFFGHVVEFMERLGITFTYQVPDLGDEDEDADIPPWTGGAAE